MRAQSVSLSVCQSYYYSRSQRLYGKGTRDIKEEGQHCTLCISYMSADVKQVGPVCRFVRLSVYHTFHFRAFMVKAHGHRHQREWPES